MAIDLKHNNREQIKKRKERCWSTSVPAVDVYAATPLTFCTCRQEKRFGWWFSREQRRECVFFSRSLLDMREDGTDHVLRSWCLQLRRGRCHGRRTLLLDILKVMYIKAELFWLGRCQNTFIWSGKHSIFVSFYKDLQTLCKKRSDWTENDASV